MIKFVGFNPPQEHPNAQAVERARQAIEDDPAPPLPRVFIRPRPARPSFWTRWRQRRRDRRVLRTLGIRS